MTSWITLDGVRDVDLGFRVLKEKEPLLPSTRDRVLTIDGRAGSYDFGAFLQERSFVYSCVFVGDGTNYTEPSAIALQQRIRELARFLLDSKGRPRTIELIRYTEPDKCYFVRFSGAATLEKMIYNTVGTFDLELTAFDPFAKLIVDADDIILDTDILLESDVRLDDAFEYLVVGSYTFEINNVGSLDAEPVIEVFGNFASLSINVNGQTFGYTESGTSLTINSERMTVKSGSTNKLGKMTGNFPILQPGVNNVTISGTGLNATVSFKFRPKFS